MLTCSAQHAHEVHDSALHQALSACVAVALLPPDEKALLLPSANTATPWLPLLCRLRSSIVSWRAEGHTLAESAIASLAQEDQHRQQPCAQAALALRLASKDEACRFMAQQSRLTHVVWQCLLRHRKQRWALCYMAMLPIDDGSNLACFAHDVRKHAGLPLLLEVLKLRDHMQIPLCPYVPLLPP